MTSTIYIDANRANSQVKSIDTNQIFTGKVSRINAKVNSQTQSIEVYIRIKDKNLKEGMYMEAQIKAMEFSNVFALDRGLVNGEKELFAVRKNKLVKPFEVGMLPEELKQIESSKIRKDLFIKIV